MNAKSTLVGLAVVAAVGVGTAVWLGSDDESLVPEATVSRTTDAGPETVEPSQSVDHVAPDDRIWDGVELPATFFQKLPPNSRVEMHLDPKWFTSGLRCPGGGYLPMLNGIKLEDLMHVPVIGRDEGADGPLPPVVAKRTDPNGLEYYEHADGSTTTMEWTTGQFNGKPVRMVVTDHIQPYDESYGLTPGVTAPIQDPAKRN